MEKTLNSPGFPLPAVAWSLGLHAVALLALTPAIVANEAAVPLPRLAAELRPAPVPAPASAVVPAPTFAPPVPAARPLARAVPVPDVVQSVPAPVSAAVVPVAGGERAASETPAAVTVATAALASPSVPAAPDAGSLRQYRVALASEARRVKRYPERARRDGLTGMVEVRINISVAGLPPQIEVSRSSGHAVLDAAALEMMQRAALRTPLPEALRDQRFAVPLPVVFEVED